MTSNLLSHPSGSTRLIEYASDDYYEHQFYFIYDIVKLRVDTNRTQSKRTARKGAMFDIFGSVERTRE